jgi:hypothetical protein
MSTLSRCPQQDNDGDGEAGRRADRRFARQAGTARRPGRAGHELVAWVQRYAADAATASTNLITMTGHASQVFSRDDDWLQALHHARRALRPGGQVAFDRHTPHVHGWEA